MNVTLDQSLLDYMHDHHHKILTLSYAENMRNFHHVLYNKYPLIKYTVPKEIEDYDVYHYDDITVYISKETQVDGDKLEFHDRKLWDRHTCYVVGMKSKNRI